MEENISEPQAEVLPQTTDKTHSSSGGSVDVETLNMLLVVEKDKYVRLLAEFENMRKRHERERLELIKYAHEEVIVESLKIYDDLERSLTAFKAKEGMDLNLVKGLQMIYDGMKELMQKYDVKPIESVGKKFDPNFHEPLLTHETTEHPDGHIMEEFQKGYTMAGRIVRTSKVKVAKNINS